MKIAINRCYGGFGLSPKAMVWLEVKGQKQAIEEINQDREWVLKYGGGHSIPRNDPLLIEVIELFGEEANGDCAKLVIEEYDLQWEIDSYDGMETIGGSFMRVY